ncbi:MAG: hypothetical protein ACRD6W_09060, partial [Nitrososphaerales archaeon]
MERGFSGTRDEALAIWQAAAARWSSVNGRPSSGDLAVYRELAAQKLGGRILILGVTPEIRDLVAEAGARPVLVDISAAMYEATSRMLRCGDRAHETRVESEWAEFRDSPGTFDLVLGDMIWWALSVAHQVQVRDNVHSLLNPDGLFVGRVRFTEVSRAELDPLPVVAAYLSRLADRPSDARRIETELLSWIYDHTADHVGGRLDRARASALLIELATAPELERGANFLLEAATRLVNADWTSQSR